jgi:OmpA-OmpF porin, OOP family
MVRSILRAFAFALLLAAGSASAREPSEWGAYVAVDMGTTYFNVGKGRLDEWSEAPSGNSSLDKGDRSFSLAAGFRFSPYLAVEAAYLDLGTSSYLITDETGAASVGFGSQGAAVSLLGSWPFNRTFSLEGRAGLYFGESQMRGWVTATFDLGDGELVSLEGAGGGNPGLLFGAGVVARLGENLAVRLGYDYLSGNAIAMRNTDLDANMESSAGRVSLGIRYLF